MKNRIVKLFVLMMSLIIGVQAMANVKGKTNAKGKVLLVASSTNKLKLKNGSLVDTGYFLGELAVPAMRLIDEGYDVVVATPQGNAPTLDQKSVHVSMFNNDQKAMDKALNFVRTYSKLLKPLKLENVANGNLDEYVAVYIPGGHAPMNDLMIDKNLGKILRYFHEKGKPTALLCHGPIALISALDNAKEYQSAMISGDFKAQEEYGKNWIYADYKMTIYSNPEEYRVEQGILKSNIEFYVADALQVAKGIVNTRAIDEKHVVRDRELITGQNPNSDHAIAEELVKAIKEDANK